MRFFSLYAKTETTNRIFTFILVVLQPYYLQASSHNCLDWEKKDDYLRFPFDHRNPRTIFRLRNIWANLEIYSQKLESLHNFSLPKQCSVNYRGIRCLSKKKCFVGDDDAFLLTIWTNETLRETKFSPESHRKLKKIFQVH